MDQSVFFRKDGKMILAHRAEFTDLEESITGWGKTEEEAAEDLRRVERAARDFRNKLKAASKSQQGQV